MEEGSYSSRREQTAKIKRSSFAGRWLADAPALSVIVLFFIACFGGFLLRGQFLIGGDAFFHHHPLRTVAFNMIRSGQLPLWTPLIWSGYPLLSMSQLGIAYPLNWTHLFLPGHWAVQIYVLAPFLLAPAFTYAYLRTIRLSRTAALLAALSFAYGGLMTNTYGMNGAPINALMWLPLMLLVIERSLSKSFIPSLIAATLVYSLSILTGHGQGFLQVGTLALAYALFLSLTSKQERFQWRRWRPFVLVVLAIVFACGITAFQILETMRAARRSIRATLTAEDLGAGGFTFAAALRSFVAPLFHHLEVTTYQSPLIVLLALSAVILVWRLPERRDPRIWFWLCVAAVAFVLLLGGNTPAYRLLSNVPIVNLFRRPARHAFEWTFAISILAAYGWDSVHRYASLHSNQTGKEKLSIKVVSGGIAFFLGVALAFLWWRSVKNAGSEAGYLWWKIAFTFATTAAIIWAISKPSLRTSLATLVLILVCFVEPFILIERWWAGTAKPGARFTTPALTTSWLQQVLPLEQRVYVRANGPDEELAARPRIDALDRTALFGLHNVAGYDPFLFDRYSRALGNVDFDSVGPRAGFAPTNDLFESKSHVLDLLNTGYVVTWRDLATTPDSNVIEQNGVRFNRNELGLVVEPGNVANVPAAAIGDQILVVTSLAHSVPVTQDTIVARLRLKTADARTIELPIRAGVETAEWAHERADVKANIQHELAPIFDQKKGDAEGSFSALRYLARISLGTRTQINSVEIENVHSQAAIAVWKITILDSVTGLSSPMSNLTLDSNRWQIVNEVDGVQILRNRRHLSRAWVVAEAIAVDGEQALRRISDDPTFDPRRTVLLEVNPDEIPQLPGGMVSSDTEVRLVEYQPTQLTIETKAPTNTVLVLSEMFYPGWEATLDGQRVPIMLANYLLRAVAVPGGEHQIQLRYRAPAARNGAIISAVTLATLLGLFIYSRRTAKAQSNQ